MKYYTTKNDYIPITRHKLKSGNIVRVIEGPDGVQLFIKRTSLNNDDIVIMKEIEDKRIGFE